MVRKKRAKIALQTTIHKLELVQEQWELSAEEFLEWSHCKTQLEHLYKEEEIHWNLRAKQKWLEDGDGNTKYFHTVATHKKKANRINYLDIDGKPNSNLSDIKKHIMQYYKNILGTTERPFACMDPHFWSVHDKVTSLENFQLDSPFTEEEIHKALFDSEATGAPGPDGFTFLFYQTYWKIVKKGYTDYVPWVFS